MTRGFRGALGGDPDGLRSGRDGLGGFFGSQAVFAPATTRGRRPITRRGRRPPPALRPERSTRRRSRPAGPTYLSGGRRLPQDALGGVVVVVRVGSALTLIPDE